MRSICHLFDLNIDKITPQGVLQKLEEFIATREPHQLAYLNAHCVNRTFTDDEYRRIILDSALVYADGMALVWVSHLTNDPLPERVNAGDFLPDLCRLCEQKQYKLYFLGSEPGVAVAAADQLKKQFPTLQIVGTQHGYFTEAEEQSIISEIINSKPDILLVGFGVPQQEKWLAKNLQKLNVPVAWGVGALLEYYALKTPRAPRWMRQSGLEWLYRLYLEPRRMWRRYLVGNMVFIMHILALVLVDIISVSISWIAAYWIREYLSELFGKRLNPFYIYLYALPLIIVLWVIMSAWYGLYQRHKVGAEFHEFLAIAKASLLVLLITMAVAFMIKEWDLARSVVLLSGILNFFFLLISRKVNQLFKLE
ncbi:MAG: WecB/TagA/CpsF family glycosyltransferase, partial [bacterium]|nr:WecB/TagA/CpsF family glycosyltransferase [bacterium]